jgi:hypothetical protein
MAVLEGGGRELVYHLREGGLVVATEAIVGLRKQAVLSRQSGQVPAINEIFVYFQE